jgi:cytoplasmic iron level regulating protein YaaA (DUF328/UPF0246 family)
MKFILSPTRNIRDIAIDITQSKSLFETETIEILESLKKLNPWELESLLKTNEKIAFKAFVNIQDINLSAKGTPALYAYDGLVYKYINPLKLSKSAVIYAQSSMRIISAFYGLLKPLDSIHPYRLEMQSKLKINNKTLYDFWGSKLYESLYENDNCVVNLASEEYAKTIRKYIKPNDIFIDIIFHATVKGRRQTVATIAKMARGSMAKYILENAIDKPEALKYFDWDGFTYVKELSYPTRYVYTIN